MSKINAVINNPYIMLAKIIKDRAHFLPDEVYLRIIYRACFGKKLNLDDPLTYNEKLQWLKLYDRNPYYSKLVDKYEVKKIVADKVGEKYIIPTFGVWNTFDEIDFNSLPSSFVLKCTHDSGGLVLVPEKCNLNIQMAKEKINSSMRKNFFWSSREWPYKNVSPRIIAEQYIDDPNGDLKDYKFFCFNGTPSYLFVASDRNKPGIDVKFDYFDIEFNRLNMRQSVHETSTYDIQKPRHYDEMIWLANKLSEGIPQVRIDLYEANNQVYFGECTFFHHGGFVPFEPDEWDKIWGTCIKLPNPSNKRQTTER